MQKQAYFKRLKTLLTQKSILWRAVLHSVLLSTLIIAGLSAVSYLFMVSLLKGDMVDMDVYMLLQGITTLGRYLIIVGVVFVSLAIVLSFSFAKNLTGPFLEIRSKVEKIKRGHWNYRKTIKTGDEAEELDTVMASLTRRLREIYNNLEDEVALRTDSLEKEFEKDKAILNAINIGLLIVDKGGKIMDMNPAAEGLLKINKNDFIGKPVILAMSIRRRGKILGKKEHPVMQCIRNKKDVEIPPRTHIEVQCSDGMYIPVRISAIPLIQKKKLWGGLVLFQDVTVERQLDSMKAEFITLASHNLRTPLASIQWYLELLTSECRDKLTKEQKSFIKNMKVASEKMTNIVGELMDASRLQEGGITPVSKIVDIHKLVQDVIDGMQLFVSDKEAKITLSGNGFGLKTSTDPVLLSIVIQNLLDNSVKYSKKGGKIEIRITKTSKQVSISVEDNGMGIPYKEKDRIFEKLFRAENARKVDSNGSGLGLFFCKMIVEKLGGGIGFISKENKGTTFVVSLPLNGKKG